VTRLHSRLHRIEALPGEGRYAVTFQRPDGVEQTAVVQLEADRLDAAEASLPEGLTRSSAAFAALTDAVRAVDAARGAGPPAAALVDVDGGWDVMMGNVSLVAQVPTCTAHGPMDIDGARFVCAVCGARAAIAV
jgi:hypothetical protein